MTHAPYLDALIAELRAIRGAITRETFAYEQRVGDSYPWIERLQARIGAVADALSAAKAQGAWQPIETAPKDETVVDLWVQSLVLRDRDTGKMEVGVEFRVPDAHWFSGGWTDQDGNPHPYLEGFTDLLFTHWRPLPAAPEPTS